MAGTNIGRDARDLVAAMERENPDLSAAARARAAWARAADARVREHVTGVFVVPHTDASELIVYADSPIWAAELGMQAELLRMKLNLELARMDPGTPRDGRSEQVKKLRFVASKEKYLAKDRRQSTYEQLEEEEDELSRVEPVPLSREEAARLEAAAAGIGDERLRDAALSAAKANIAWRRGLDAAGK